MDPSSPHPVYSGTSPQHARTPHALVPDSFAMQETWQQGMAQQTQNAIDFRDAAIDRIEYTIDQNRQTQTDQALAAMQADFIANPSSRTGLAASTMRTAHSTQVSSSPGSTPTSPNWTNSKEDTYALHLSKRQTRHSRKSSRKHPSACK